MNSEFFIYTLYFGAIVGATCAVTLQDLRRASYGLACAVAAMSGLFLLDGSLILACLTVTGGIVAVSFLWRRQQRRESTKNGAILEYEAKALPIARRGSLTTESPNAVAGFFIVACFLLCATPTWMFTSWRPQGGEPLSDIERDILHNAFWNYRAVSQVAFSLVVVALLAGLRRTSSEFPVIDSDFVGAPADKERS